MERRLAAVLALDMEGYSAMMGRDEPGTHRRLRRDLDQVVRPALLRHGGRIDRIEGDDVLAEFPSAVAAVMAARKIQAVMTRRNRSREPENRVWFRIGIHAGEICHDGMALFGDTVNIAFRLEALAPPGGSLVSEAVRSHAAARLNLKLTPRGSLQLKNIASPVTAFLLGPVVDEGRAGLLAVLLRWRTAAVTAAMLLLIAAFALWTLHGRNGAEAPMGMPSIAVLPFTSTATDIEKRSFVSGITHDIMTDLSKFEGLSVVSATSTARFLTEAPRPIDIGRDLRVRYVLEGNVQWIDDRVRVNAQLIDAFSERHVWADRFDSPVMDLASAQDMIAEKVVRVIGPIGNGSGILLAEEMRRIRDYPTDSLLSYEHFLTGVRQFEQYDEVGTRAAQISFARAISLDPGNIAAMSYLALAYLNEYRLGWAAEPHRALLNAVVEAERAIALGPGNSNAFRVLGLVRHYQRRHDEAENAFRYALELNPNDTDAMMWLGWSQTFAGDVEAGLAMMQEAHSQTPFAPGWYLYNIAWGHFLLRDYHRSAEVLEERVPRSTYSRLLLGLAYTRLGRTEAATTEIAAFRASVPGYSVAFADRVLPFAEEDDRNHFLEGLRMAGIPEG